MIPCSVPTSAILIVGAGPTGLTLAHELLRRGVKPRLIEKTPSTSPNTKALGVMARTLELLAPAGITTEMLAQGVRVPTFSMWSSGRQLARLDFAKGTDSAYPFILMLPQHTTEAILTDHVVRQGGRVERGIELVSLTQRAESVEAVLRHADGTEERTWSNFLIGCDGAHSAVRHLLGVPFVGTTVAQRFVSGNVRMHGRLPHDQALAYLNRGRLIAYFPLPDGQHRFLSASPAGESPRGEVTSEEIQRVIEACGPIGARATEPSWLARYYVHQRKVDCYVHRRVLLAGDAAHVHSPLGAQGMNTGIQDAINLAWKLALVAQGYAPARLLESYQIERAQVGTRLLQEDALLTRLAFVHHPLVTATRDRVAPCLTRHLPLQRLVTTTAAGLRISYHRGPLVFDHRGEQVRSAASSVNVGSRAPNGPVVTSRHAAPSQLYDLLAGTSHALLIFTPQRGEGRRHEVQAALADWQHLLEVYPIRRFDPNDMGEQTWHDPDGALAERYGLGDEGLVLIRPDGYISFRSRSIAEEPLQRYLRAHFSLQHAS
jgi:2-polyprenyl-6-methoxyphenol hydroxylase-like FAD-dependent oxidoreductase